MTEVPGVCELGNRWRVCEADGTWGEYSECEPVIEPGVYAEDCSNGADDDCDGLTDAEDPDCRVSKRNDWIPGDADKSGCVNDDDFIKLVVNWLREGVDWSGGDFNGDSTVNAIDFSLLAANWGKGSCWQQG